MRLALLPSILALGLAAAPARAQLPEPVLLRITLDAMQLMDACPDGSRGATCRHGRDQFVEAYAGARTGRLAPMRRVAELLREGAAPVRRDAARACSWTMMAMVMSSGAEQDKAALAQHCLTLPEPQQEAAQRAVAETLAAMASDLEDIKRAQATKAGR